MQPLDVGVYGPFKRNFNTACESWMLSHPAKTITIYDIAELSGQAFGEAFSHCNITSSFNATHPMNRNIFPDDAFLSAAVTDRCVDVNTPATEPAASTSKGSPAASTSQGSPAASTSQGSPAASTSQGSPAASTSQGSLAASTRKRSPESSERHTPEELWPYPKAAPRKAAATKRRKRKSAIITDTHEKEEFTKQKKRKHCHKTKESEENMSSFRPGQTCRPGREQVRNRSHRHRQRHAR